MGVAGSVPKGTEQLASGAIDLLVLRVVADGDSHGYATTQALDSHGLVDVSEATVYTSLKRLAGLSHLDSRSALADNGRARCY